MIFPEYSFQTVSGGVIQVTQSTGCGVTNTPFTGKWRQETALLTSMNPATGPEPELFAMTLEIVNGWRFQIKITFYQEECQSSVSRSTCSSCPIEREIMF